MKLPGEDGLRAIVMGLIVLVILGVGAWLYLSGKSHADFSNVVGQVKTLQASSDLSRIDVPK